MHGQRLHRRIRWHCAWRQGTATGVGGANASGLDLGASFTNVPGGTANWTFTDVTGNYNNKSGSVNIVINRVDPTCT